MHRTPTRRKSPPLGRLKSLFKLRSRSRRRSSRTRRRLRISWCVLPSPSSLLLSKPPLRLRNVSKLTPFLLVLRVSYCDEQAPKLVAVETQIAHSEKKATTAESLGEKVQRDVTRQTESLESLRADLKKVEKLAKEAEGESGSSFFVFLFRHQRDAFFSSTTS